MGSFSVAQQVCKSAYRSAEFGHKAQCSQKYDFHLTDDFPLKHVFHLKYDFHLNILNVTESSVVLFFMELVKHVYLTHS